MDNKLSKFYAKEKITQRSYSSEQIIGVNTISQKINHLMQAKNVKDINQKSLGLDWQVIDKEEKSIFFESKSLNWLAKISSVEDRGQKYYVLYLEKKEQLGYNEKTKKEELILFNIKTTPLKNWFSCSEIQTYAPVEELTEKNTKPKTKLELLKEMERKIGSAALKYYEKLNCEQLGEMLNVFPNEKSSRYIFNNSQQMLCILANLVGIKDNLSKMFLVSSKENEQFEADNQGKKLSICFDFIYDSLLKLNIIGRRHNRKLDMGDGDELYLLEVLDKKIICINTGTSGWLVVKDKLLGAWTCYNFSSPFNSPQELMRLGPSIIKPSLIIENYKITSFDTWLSYFKYPLLYAIESVQEGLEKNKLSPSLSSEGLVLHLEEKVKEIDVLLEKQRLEKILAYAPLKTLKMEIKI